ncbi:MAG: DUF1638 domain-containing protein [Gracilibacteraceae bacterium]|nr:DUF1638 domain-containing protein [Gracilibacteraceae bacterium]
MTILIACKVLQRQAEALGMPYESIYLEQGLHKYPQLLTKELQKAVDASGAYGTILLGYGLCSRAVVGLRAASHQKMIIPRIDDCIGICMGGRERYYREFHARPGTYYFTRGWVEVGDDPLRRYYEILEKYDEETADYTTRDNLKHYRETVFIRNDAAGEEEARAYAQKFADFFGLAYSEIDGSAEYLAKLFSGPRDEDFVTVQGGQALTDEMFQPYTAP